MPPPLQIQGPQTLVEAITNYSVSFARSAVRGLVMKLCRFRSGGMRCRYYTIKPCRSCKRKPVLRASGNSTGTTYRGTIAVRVSGTRRLDTVKCKAVWTWGPTTAICRGASGSAQVTHTRCFLTGAWSDVVACLVARRMPSERRGETITPPARL